MSPTLKIMSAVRSEEHTSELQSRSDLVCRLLLEKQKMAGYSATSMPSSSGRRVRSCSSHRSRGWRRSRLVVATGWLPTTAGSSVIVFNDTATTEIYTLSLHDALPIWPEAMLVAGGTDLYPNMKRRQFEPTVLIGLRGIRDMIGVRGSAKAGMTIGA